MAQSQKYSVITASLGNVGDRFCLECYKRSDSFARKLEQLQTIEGLTGVELVYDGDEANLEDVRRLVTQNHLQVPVVNAPLSSSRKWQLGTLTSKDAETRSAAIALTKETIDFARAIGAEMVNLWLGQDGFDYCFQVDYRKQWESLIEAVQTCADYRADVRLGLEFKPREPRKRSLMNSAATTLLMIQEIDRANVGLTVDVGHVLQNRENMAQVVELADRYGKLYHLHLNDNYSAWDDDMIVGSVHLVEFLELFYVLRKIQYEGWYSIDIFPFREDQYGATRESIEFMRLCERWIERVGYDHLSHLVSRGEVTEILRSVRTTIFR